MRGILCGAVLGILGFACSTTGPNDAQPARKAAEKTESEEKPVWLVDEQGRSYYIRKVPRVEGLYYVVDKNHVRIQNGLTLEIVNSDDQFFYAKIFGQPTEKDDSAPAPVDPEIARTYVPDTAVGNAWELTRVDTGLPQAGQWRNGFAVGDVNGDGLPDIFSGPPRASLQRVPRVWLNHGSADFKSPVGMYVPAAPYDYGDAEIADFDGDGDNDLALAAHLGSIVVLVAQDQGEYTLEQLPAITSPPASAFSSRALAVGDWDGDGRPDLLASSEGPAVRHTRAEAGTYTGGKVIYMRGRDGKWSFRTAANRESIFGDVITVGDFNGDGRLDFATSVSIFGNRSILNLQQPDGSWVVETLNELRPDSLVGSIAAFDFNGDRRSELAIGYQSAEGREWRSGIDLFIATDQSWQRRTLWSETGRAGVFAVAAGDLDGDGRVDLAALTGDGRILPFRRVGDAYFREAPIRAAGRECRGYDIEIADLDHDGAAELVAAFAGEKCPAGGQFQVWRTGSKN